MHVVTPRQYFPNIKLTWSIQKWPTLNAGSRSSVAMTHGRTGRKKLAGRKEICPTFSDCARVVKKNFPEKLSKIVVDEGGRSDYEKFLLDSIFSTKLTEFPTKLTEFVPFIFIISQYICPTGFVCPPPARYTHAMTTRYHRLTTQKSISIAFCVSSIRHDSSLSKYLK
jgi:hypothetical protein